LSLESTTIDQLKREWKEHVSVHKCKYNNKENNKVIILYIIVKYNSLYNSKNIILYIIVKYNSLYNSKNIILYIIVKYNSKFQLKKYNNKSQQYLQDDLIDIKIGHWENIF